MNADAGAGVGIVTVYPVFVGTMNVVADSKAYTAGGCCESRVRQVIPAYAVSFFLNVQ